MVFPSRAAERSKVITLELLDEIFRNCSPRNFQVRLWDNTLWNSGMTSSPEFTIVLKKPGSLRQMFLPPTQLNLGEAYIYDDFDIEGNIKAVFAIAEQIATKITHPAEQMLIGAKMLTLPRESRKKIQKAVRGHGDLHSATRDREAIAYHYNRPNEFYQLFLDSRMVYSCGYFHNSTDSLEMAQEQKLDYICRKLRLQPGEHLLDIGCGWGGLLMYAAERYHVRATGVTLSENQAVYAREVIKQKGLEANCTVLLQDYRDIQAPKEKFDKIVSVGMFEHVGSDMLQNYFETVKNLLKPGGVFLNHGIARNYATPPIQDNDFISYYVFPDGELLTLSETIKAAEASGFEARDVENLREHYALTLSRWVAALEANADSARTITDDFTYRIWRLYMAASMYSFQIGDNNLFQILLVNSPHGACNLPLRRSDWYL